jgi:AraC family transcriptional regulator, regulatory protein of adaptative response / methylated-DNA-[protein]-cysteine methyltransferase
MTRIDHDVATAEKTLQVAVGDSSLGPILVASSEKGVSAILFGSDRDALLAALRAEFPHAGFVEIEEGQSETFAKVVRLVEQPARGFDLPLDMEGSDFQRRVWQAIETIPVGETASYAEVARKIGSPDAVRAVAQACGANRLAVAIPCHRIGRADGSPSGYRWGMDRKQALLAREAGARSSQLESS